MGLCLLGLCAAPVRSDSTTNPLYVIDTWETEQGLPENSATAMVQSSDGYLWFGTFNGLVRFDGIRFDVLDPGNTPELPAAAVVNVFLDGDERLWVSTLQGVAVRDRGRWRTVGKADGWVGDYARSFAERANGDLLITTFDNRLLEYSGDRFIELAPPPGKPLGHCLAAADASGRWWITRGGFIGAWDGAQWIPPAEAPRDRSDMACVGARDRGVWVLAGRELLKYGAGTGVVRRELAEPIRGVWSLYEDSRGNVWACTHDRGAVRIGPDGELRRWSTSNGLAHDGVRFAFEDQELNLWLGTSGGGLAKLRLIRARTHGLESGLGARVVNSLCEDAAGGVLVATYGKGLFRLEEGAARAVRLSPDKDVGAYVQSVLTDRRGRVWAGTYGDGLFVIDESGARPVTHERSGGGNVIALFEDSRGRVWVSGGQTVSVFDGNEPHVYEGGDGSPLWGVCAFAEDREGRIWISNQSHVCRLDHGEFVEVLDPNGRRFGDVICLQGEPDGAMWMGSRTAGLLRWRGGGLDRVSERLELPVRSVHGILADDRGFWWLATNQGVVRVRQAELAAAADGELSRVRYQRLGVKDGLTSIECAGGRQPVCAKDDSGRLWFATVKGAAVVDPALFDENQVPPPVQIEELRSVSPGAGPHDLLSDAGTAEGRRRADPPPDAGIVVPPESERIEIRYTGLSFTDPERVRFEVKMEGLDSDWEDAGDKRVATYHDLSPGAYVFRVRAANNDGVWNETGASVAFRVQPFWWQTWWAMAGLGIVLIGSGASVAAWGCRARAVRVRERSEFRQQRSELAHLSRVTMLGELSGSLAHELNQPLTAILSNAQAAQRFLAHEPADMDEVHAILSDIVDQDKRAGEVIHGLRLLLKKGEVEQSMLDVGEVVRDALRLVRSDLINHGVAAEIDLGPALPMVRGDRVQLQQVLLNLVMNACDAMASVPMSARRLVVTARSEGGKRVRVSVADTGTGIGAGRLDQVFQPFFSSKEKGMGLGLAVSRTIIAAHGGEIWAADNPGGGAALHLTLPALEPAPT